MELLHCLWQEMRARVQRADNLQKKLSNFTLSVFSRALLHEQTAKMRRLVRVGRARAQHIESDGVGALNIYLQAGWHLSMTLLLPPTTKRGTVGWFSSYLQGAREEQTQKSSARPYSQVAVFGKYKEREKGPALAPMKETRIIQKESES